MKMEQTQCSETSAYKIQTPGNYPKESIQHTEHDESLKLRIHHFCLKRIIGIKLAYTSDLLFITEMSFKLQFTHCLSDMSLEIIRATSFVQSFN